VICISEDVSDGMKKLRFAEAKLSEYVPTDAVIFCKLINVKLEKRILGRVHLEFSSFMNQLSRSFHFDSFLMSLT
jgi:hypothetical protein